MSSGVKVKARAAQKAAMAMRYVVERPKGIAAPFN